MSTPSIATSPGVTTGQYDITRARRQLSHDINHELATIRLLTTLLTSAPDVGPESRRRAALILGETRWLEQLQRAYESAAEQGVPTAWEADRPVRVDDVATEVVDAMRPASLTAIRIATTPVSARVNRLALWRVLRNIIDNGLRAAGQDGTVDVRIHDSGTGWAVIQIDDDGPGFGYADSGRTTWGLNIVQDFVLSAGGQLDIHRGGLGGCGVRIRLPLIASGDDRAAEGIRS
jgi:C4-dicarboxylate-specific signal transduction histidine kinase